MLVLLSSHFISEHRPLTGWHWSKNKNEIKNRCLESRETHWGHKGRNAWAEEMELDGKEDQTGGRGQGGMSSFTALARPSPGSPSGRPRVLVPDLCNGMKSFQGGGLQQTQPLRKWAFKGCSQPEASPRTKKSLRIPKFKNRNLQGKGLGIHIYSKNPSRFLWSGKLGKLQIKMVFLERLPQKPLGNLWDQVQILTCKFLTPEPENQNSKRSGACSLESEFIKKVSRWFWCALQWESHRNSMVAKSMCSGVDIPGLKPYFPIHQLWALSRDLSRLLTVSLHLSLPICKMGIIITYTYYIVCGKYLI